MINDKDSVQRMINQTANNQNVTEKVAQHIQKVSANKQARKRTLDKLCSILKIAQYFVMMSLLVYYLVDKLLVQIRKECFIIYDTFACSFIYTMVYILIVFRFMENILTLIAYNRSGTGESLFYSYVLQVTVTTQTMHNYFSFIIQALILELVEFFAHYLILLKLPDYWIDQLTKLFVHYSVLMLCLQCTFAGLGFQIVMITKAVYRCAASSAAIREEPKVDASEGVGKIARTLCYAKFYMAQFKHNLRVYTNGQRLAII